MLKLFFAWRAAKNTRKTNLSVRKGNKIAAQTLAETRAARGLPKRTQDENGVWIFRD